MIMMTIILCTPNKRDIVCNDCVKTAMKQKTSEERSISIKIVLTA